MKKYVLLVLSFSVVVGLAQEKRNFEYNGIEVPYYKIANVKNHRMPNHNAQIVLLNDDQINIESIKSLHQKYKQAETISYFLKVPLTSSSRKTVEFLKEFIAYNYPLDFFDRNTVKLIANEDLQLECDDLNQLNTSIAAIQVRKENQLLKCDQPFISDEPLIFKGLSTSKRYKETTLDERLFLKDAYDLNQSLKKWRRTFYITATYGHNSLLNGVKTNFDEETLVDFSDVNNAWSFKMGYMFNDRFGANLQIGFSIAPQTMDQEFGGVSGNLTINGTGSGAGIIKIGFGGRYLPYVKNRLSLYTDLYIGNLIATAGGGSGTVTITNNGISQTNNILEKTERTPYISPEIGLNYRFGKVLFGTGNVNYTYSNFQNDIGSVSGISGYSINFGLGLSF